LTYLITFSCYGVHLHGDDSGSVDRLHHLYRSRLANADPERAFIERTHLHEPPYLLRPEYREIVLQSIREVCLHRGWTLRASHVRSTHVHTVVEGDSRPEAMMNAFKAYASRALNRSEKDDGSKVRWARHGSTRWLWNQGDVRAAVDYVTAGQGEPMAVYLAEW
jgi:REP element-mobilizing transposase RayT